MIINDRKAIWEFPAQGTPWPPYIDLPWIIYSPRYLNTALVACLTVEAGCIRYRLKVEKYSGQLGNKNPGDICYKKEKKQNSTNYYVNWNVCTVYSTLLEGACDIVSVQTGLFVCSTRNHHQLNVTFEPRSNYGKVPYPRAEHVGNSGARTRNLMITRLCLSPLRHTCPQCSYVSQKRFYLVAAIPFSLKLSQSQSLE